MILNRFEQTVMKADFEQDKKELDKAQSEAKQRDDWLHGQLQAMEQSLNGQQQLLARAAALDNLQVLEANIQQNKKDLEALAGQFGAFAPQVEGPLRRSRASKSTSRAT